MSDAVAASVFVSCLRSVASSCVIVPIVTRCVIVPLKTQPSSARLACSEGINPHQGISVPDFFVFTKETQWRMKRNEWPLVPGFRSHKEMALILCLRVSAVGALSSKEAELDMFRVFGGAQCSISEESACLS